MSKKLFPKRETNNKKEHAAFLKQWNLAPHKDRNLGLRDVKFNGPFKNLFWNLSHTIKCDILGRGWDRLWYGHDRTSHWSYDYYFLNQYEDVLRWLAQHRMGSPVPRDIDSIEGNYADEFIRGGKEVDIHNEWTQKLVEQIKKVANLREKLDYVPEGHYEDVKHLYAENEENMNRVYKEIFDWLGENIRSLWD